jgi:hypothetical protein
LCPRWIARLGRGGVMEAPRESQGDRSHASQDARLRGPTTKSSGYRRNRSSHGAPAVDNAAAALSMRSPRWRSRLRLCGGRIGGGRRQRGVRGRGAGKPGFPVTALFAEAGCRGPDSCMQSSIMARAASRRPCSAIDRLTLVAASANRGLIEHAPHGWELLLGDVVDVYIQSRARGETQRVTSCWSRPIGKQTTGSRQ